MSKKRKLKKDKFPEVSVIDFKNRVITVSKATKVSDGNYGSASIFAGQTVDVPDGVDVMEAFEQAYKECEQALENETNREVK